MELGLLTLLGVSRGRGGRLRLRPPARPAAAAAGRGPAALGRRTSARSASATWRSRWRSSRSSASSSATRTTRSRSCSRRCSSRPASARSPPRRSCAGCRGSLRFVSYALSARAPGRAAARLPAARRGGRRCPSRRGWRSSPRLVGPVGLLLGVFFPTGLDRLKRRRPGLGALGLGAQRHGLGRRAHPRRGGVDDGRGSRALPRGGAGIPARRLHGRPAPRESDV